VNVSKDKERFVSPMTINKLKILLPQIKKENCQMSNNKTQKVADDDVSIPSKN